MLRTRALSLVGAAAVILVGCPGPGPQDAGDTVPADAADALEQPDVPEVVRCGPGAVPYMNTIGACYSAAPVPDGGAPSPGRCTVTVNAPSATARTNAMDGAAVVIPSGRRVTPAAARRGLSGFPMSTLRLPGTSLIVVSDGGIHTQRLRVVDTAQASLPVVAGGEAAFPTDGSGRDPSLFYGLAYDATARVLYASGGGGNRVYAYDVSAAGALTANPGRTIDLGLREVMAEGVDGMGALRSGYVAGVALSPDGTRLYAAMQRGHSLAVFNTATRALERVVPFETVEGSRPFPYAVVRRPGDDAHVYVSLWGTSQVAEVDVATFAVTRLFSVGKNPEELVFSPDGSRLYVAASDSDAIAVVDLSMPSAPVANNYLGGGAMAPRGISPTALAWGPMNRLYVVQANENAVAVYDSTTFALVGRIPTEWYPTDVDVAPDGTVVVITGKGLGSGPNLAPRDREITELMDGSIARYPAPTDATLAAGEATATQNNGVMRTFNDVACPAGAEYDFPIPRVGSTTASTRIRRVVLVIRENKTYDALLGDYPGTPSNPAEGDPTLTILPRAEMDAHFPNFRGAVRAFAHMDNYYSNAEQSIQGHVWTTQGRTTDYTERSWLTTWGRGQRVLPSQGVLPVGIPEEGTIFHAMQRAGVRAENWGELVGSAPREQSVGGRYPGLVYNLGVRDINKAIAFGNHAQRQCGLVQFSYILLPNDHTEGGTPGRPTPRSMFMDNDEATGYLIDALSHSTYWPETLVVVIEDDPQDGGDHVDNHRSIALLASPWVRRGYTSHVHYDESSLHHTIELILGVPPHNATIAAAAPMYDAFTSTPDFTPYTYTPRGACETTNPMNGLYAEESLRMDFSEPDNAPGLPQLLWRMTHDGQPAPWAGRAPESDGDDD